MRASLVYSTALTAILVVASPLTFAAKAGQSATEADLITHCKARIAGFKVPRSVTFSESELPKSGPGKILKTDLRAPFWAGRDRAVN